MRLGNNLWCLFYFFRNKKKPNDRNHVYKDIFIDYESASSYNKQYENY